MPEYLVTGIAPWADAAKVTEILADSALDQTCLSMVSKSSAHGASHAGNAAGARSLSNSSTIMTGSSGTSVPGIGGSGASFSASSHHAVADYLGGLPLIPPDQAEHFNIAISEGRTLVMYKAAPEEAAKAESAFRAAGLRNVKVFRPKEPTLSP